MEYFAHLADVGLALGGLAAFINAIAQLVWSWRRRS